MVNPEARRAPEGEFGQKIGLRFNGKAILINNELIVYALRWINKVGRDRRGLTFAFASDAQVSIQNKRGEIKKIFTRPGERFQVISRRVQAIDNVLINSYLIPLIGVGFESLTIFIGSNKPLQIEEIHEDSDFKEVLEERAARQGK